MSQFCTDTFKFSTCVNFFPITEEKVLTQVKATTIEKTGK